MKRIHTLDIIIKLVQPMQQIPDAGTLIIFPVKATVLPVSYTHLKRFATLTSRIYFAILSSSFWVNGLEFNFPIHLSISGISDVYAVSAIKKEFKKAVNQP